MKWHYSHLLKLVASQLVQIDISIFKTSVDFTVDFLLWQQPFHRKKFLCEKKITVFCEEKFWTKRFL